MLPRTWMPARLSWLRKMAAAYSVGLSAGTAYLVVPRGDPLSTRRPLWSRPTLTPPLPLDEVTVLFVTG